MTIRHPALKHWRALLLLVPSLVLLALFCLAPLAVIGIDSLADEDGIGLGRYQEVLTSAFYRQAFSNSLAISFWSSLMGLAIALPGAAALHRTSGAWRDRLVAFVNMTSNLTGVPLAFAFIIIFGANGMLTLLLRQSGLIGDFYLYSGTGLILIYTYFQIPLGMLLLYPAFEALDDDWRAAAILLGANGRQYWRHIGLPVVAPAILGTFILLFANAVGAYASAYALTGGNFNLVTVRIAGLVSGNLFLEPDLAAALALLLVGLMILVTLVSQLLLKRPGHAQ